MSKIIYKCNGCNREFSRKSVVEAHLNKIKKCSDFLNIPEKYTRYGPEKKKKVVSEEDKDQGLEDKDKDLEGQDPDHDHDDDSDTKVTEKEKTSKCSQCSKLFSNNFNRNRHEKSCKNIQSNSQTTIINNNNTDNRTYNITNNIIINVHPYHNPEILDKLREQIKKCITESIDSGECIPRVFKTIYFNEEFPENHSIKYTNSKTDKVLVHNGIRFEPKLFSAIKDQIIEKVEYTINNTANDMSSDINKKLDVQHNKKYNSKESKTIADNEFKQIKMIAHAENRTIDEKIVNQVDTNILLQDDISSIEPNIRIVETSSGPKKMISYRGTRDPD
jgi:hypothetical protein